MGPSEVIVFSEYPEVRMHNLIQEREVDTESKGKSSRVLNVEMC